MNIKEFVRLDKDEMCKYIKDKLGSPDHFIRLLVPGCSVVDMIGVKIPKVNKKRKMIKKKESSYGGLYDIAVGRNLDLWFINIEGKTVGCWWNYFGKEGKFVVNIDKDGRKEEVSNILQMFEIYDTHRELP